MEMAQIVHEDFFGRGPSGYLHAYDLPSSCRSRTCGLRVTDVAKRGWYYVAMGLLQSALNFHVQRATQPVCAAGL